MANNTHTTPFGQACLEAESKWKKKQDKKYTTDKSGESNLLLPMLALNYKERKHHIEWPAYVQPKLNGVRCLARVRGKKVEYLSRGGKVFSTLGHLTPDILKYFSDGDILDGEVFTEELTFQEIISAVKREKTENPNVRLLQYWVYDIILDKMPFVARNKLLAKKLPHCESFQGPLVLVPTLRLPGEKRMLRFHAQTVQAGFEGTIIRNSKGQYKKDFRSQDLQKFKDFIDEEFTIVGGKEGVGLAKGTITWTCLTEDGQEFDVRPRGTKKQRAYWYKHRKKYYGERLTVRYQNRSDTNIPIFPVGIAIRNYE